MLTKSRAEVCDKLRRGDFLFFLVSSYGVAFVIGGLVLAGVFAAGEATGETLAAGVAFIAGEAAGDAVAAAVAVTFVEMPATSCH